MTLRYGRSVKGKWMIVDPFEREPKCHAQPSKRSTARCEKPPGHDDSHIGRTRGGYWKVWNE